MKRQACPSCGYESDAATALSGDHQPSPGDITICFMCGHVMAFADDMSFRDLTTEEARFVAGNKEILAAQRARAAVIERKAKKELPQAQR